MTRFFTSADKLTDPRKAWWQKVLNPLSGVRVTDVNVDKQRAVETRAALEVNMREPFDPEPVHELKFHVKPVDRVNITPEVIEMMGSTPSFWIGPRSATRRSVRLSASSNRHGKIGQC